MAKTKHRAHAKCVLIHSTPLYTQNKLSTGYSSSKFIGFQFQPKLNATYCRQWDEQECSSCCWWGSPQHRRICHHLTSQHVWWSAPSGHARAAGVSRLTALFLLSASCRRALCRCHGSSGGWNTRCTPGPRRPSSECKAWTLELMRIEDKGGMSLTLTVKHEKHFEQLLVNISAGEMEPLFKLTASH